jgi:hypothetical protein
MLRALGSVSSLSGPWLRALGLGFGFRAKGSVQI